MGPLVASGGVGIVRRRYCDMNGTLGTESVAGGDWDALYCLLVHLDVLEYGGLLLTIFFMVLKTGSGKVVLQATNQTVLHREWLHTTFIQLH